MSFKTDILEKVDDYRWKLPTSFKNGMKVPGLIYADRLMLQHILEEHAAEQVANVAFLPGIIRYSMAMPDVHWGYGFPIGGVAAFNLENGVISPGGVGFDINCGVRLLRTNLTEEEVRPKIGQLVDRLYYNVPSGVGSQGKVKLGKDDINEVLARGSQWAVEKGFGNRRDLETTEENGRMSGADPSKVSQMAKKRGIPEMGTLGSGNHFLEVAVVDHIEEPETAGVMGINRIGQVMLLIHCGSRGLGHQVATDFVKVMGDVMVRYRINLPDRQLACAPLASPEAQDYLAAMRCAANYAWANRQCIMHWVRDSFCSVLCKSEEEAGLELVYDVSHNIAKMEKHDIEGRKQTVCVHRKGATRAFPSGHPDLPQKYSKIGQPILIPGDMGRVSYVLVGTEKAMQETFGSTCHGAGRIQSRAAVKKHLRGQQVLYDLESRGITVRAGSMSGLAEEASEAYKDVSDVVRVCQNTGISRIIARTRPIGVIKG
jgi:tRNA-splicing ligase RtcB (3'-phosphate/5'-hydroxy nucleic acid ligase)